MNLPKRDELLFRPVFALPNASRIGFDCRIAVARSPPAAAALLPLLLPPLPALPPLRERQAR